MNTTPTPTPTSKNRRSAQVLVIAVLLMAGLLGLAKPAAAYAPTAPRVVEVVAFDDFIRVHWAPPVDLGGKPITNYRIERTLLGSNVVQKTWNQGTTAPIEDKGVVKGVTYRYRVKATNADGYGSYSVDTNAILQNGKTELYRFGGDAEDFLKRQYQDFLGRQPSAFELATDAPAIELGQSSTGDVIEKLMSNGTRVQLRQPVIRLYFAYFDRAPDHGGLDHWVGKRKNGTDLDVVSASFAGSSEFKNTYGNLSNTAFISLVYNNVLDRNPDAGGAAFWQKQLGKGVSRGRMMAQFSESHEYIGKSRGQVLASDVYDDMLDKATGGSELTLWAAHIQAGGNVGDYGTRITLLNSY